MHNLLNRLTDMKGLTIVLTGQAVSILVLSSDYLFPKIRTMEDILPDHDQLEKIEEATR